MLQNKGSTHFLLMSLFKLSSSLTVLLGKPFPQAIHLLAPQEEQLAKLPPPQALALLG